MSTGAAVEPGVRILIDAVAARFGGTAYAAVHLARTLAKRGDVESVAVLTREGSIVSCGLADAPGVTRVKLRSARRLELIRRVCWQVLCLPRLVRRIDCDVLISMSGMLPRTPPCSIICLQFNPVMFDRATPMNAVRRWAFRRTTSSAIFVAAPSLALAEKVHASTGRDCGVVPLGVDHDTFSPVDQVGDELLCVSHFYAHKRHDLLLDIWLRLPSPRPCLRLIGSPAPDPSAYAALVARIRALPERDAIVVERDVSLNRLVDAYRHARVFVLTSEQESFSMPLAESMSCGVPPVVRALPSLKETAGTAGVYIEGDDPAVWARAVMMLIGDEGNYRRARAAALRAASAFSWEQFADALAAHFPQDGPSIARGRR